MSDEPTYPWWRKDASVIAVLLAFGAIAFTATYFISKSYERRQDSLARRRLSEGNRNLLAGEPQKAVANFRTALLYSHDNPAYRLRLAQALAAAGETDQAIAYFLSLLEEQPGNGLYNLELARLYSRTNDSRKTARYYNAAIYGAWEIEPAAARRRARTEFIRFLLSNHSQIQAQAEAIILAAGVPANDTPTRLEAAQLLFDTGEFRRALDEYSSLISAAPEAAYMGAAKAAFQLGRFQSALRFFNNAIARGTDDSDARNLLEKAHAVLDADPNRRRLNSGERARRIVIAYDTAGTRLQSCMTQRHPSPQPGNVPADLLKLSDEWTTAGATVNERKLVADPDLRDSIMDLVTRIEETTARVCGPPSGEDWALLMLARYGEGVEQ